MKSYYEEGIRILWLLTFVTGKQYLLISSRLYKIRFKIFDIQDYFHNSRKI
jgi:hypothetical protein